MLKRIAATDNEVLAIRCWVEKNLEASTATLSKEMGRRWLRLLMTDPPLFFQLSIFGFVSCRRKRVGDEVFPEHEFANFVSEFAAKLQVVVQGKGRLPAVPLFRHVGEMAMHRHFGLQKVR